MITTEIKISSLTLPKWNPRKIKDEGFQTLCESIKNDPEFLQARPVMDACLGVFYLRPKRSGIAEPNRHKSIKTTKMHKEVNFTPIRSDFLLAIPDVKRIPEFIEFAKWCATPSWLREEKTQKEFAERIGVSQDTLGDWKKHPEFWSLV